MSGPTYFVSNAGDDSKGVVDNPDRPWRTIGLAKAALFGGLKAAHGSILLKRGDTFDEALPFVSGLAEDQPFTFGAYGEGLRPVVTSMRAGRVTSDWVHSSIESIDFYSPAHDPLREGFVPPPGVAKWGGNFDEGVNIRARLRDCRFRYVAVVLQEKTGSLENLLEVNRCVLLDAWSPTSAHVSNLYVHSLPMWIHDSVFDHGGWIEGVDGLGEANMFNHNLYTTQSRVVLENNLILRASSIGIKFRNDGPDGMEGLVARNNFFAEGEIGISIGGVEGLPDRYIDPIVADNVFFAMGRTLSGPGGGIHAADWKSGQCTGNLMINPPDGYTGHTAFFLRFSGPSDAAYVARNVCTGVNTRKGVFQAYGGPGQRLVVEDNAFDTDNVGAAFTAQPENLVWRRNRFDFPLQPARVGQAVLQFGQKPVDASVLSAPGGGDVPNPSVTLGLSWDEFIARARAQGESGVWDESISVQAINSNARRLHGMS